MKMILAIIRVSTSQQDIESQKADLLPYILSKGFKENEIEWMEYIGASARKMDTKYLQMLEDIQTTILKKGIKNIAMWHLNRLGRNEYPLATMKEFFKNNGIQVYIKESNLQLLNDDGTINQMSSMVWSMFATMIESDTRELMDKLQRGKEYSKSKGKIHNPIIGYKRNNEGFAEIDTETSKIVLLIFNLYSTGKYSIATLINELRERGYKTNRHQIATILNDKRYCGEINEYNNIVYPQLIDKDLFDKCEKVKNEQNNNFERGNQNFNYFGNKLIVCENCGYHLTHSNKYYTDFGLMKGVCSNSTNIKDEYVDICLIEVARKFYNRQVLKSNNDIKRENNEKIALNNSKIDNLNKEISNIQKSIDRVNALFIDGRLNDSKYNEQYARFKAQIDTYKERIKILHSENSKIKKDTSVTFDNYKNALTLNNALFENLDKEKVYKLIHDSIKTSYIRKVEINGILYKAFNILTYDNWCHTYFIQMHIRTAFKIFWYNDITGKLYRWNKYLNKWEITNISIPDDDIRQMRTSNVKGYIYKTKKVKRVIENLDNNSETIIEVEV